jgi:hypothetical protein
VFVVDDLLIKPFTSLLELLQAMALDELYDADALRDELKENQLLYEVGQRSEEAYRERKAEIEAELRTAEAVRERLSDRFEVKR